MFTLIRTFDDIANIFSYRDGIIICSKNEGIGFYRENEIRHLHDGVPAYGCKFRDNFIFQLENGAGFFYLKDDFTTAEVEGSFFLFRARIDDADIFIPHRGVTHQFNKALQHVRSYQITGKTPYAVHKGMYYRLYPHFTCFSLETNEKLWEIMDDEVLEKNTVWPENFLALRGDLLIARTKFRDNRNGLIAYNALDGSIAWQRSGYFPNMRFLHGQLHVFYYNMVPFFEGRLQLIDEKNGDILKNMDLTEQFHQHDARTNGYYVLKADNDFLYLLGVDEKAVYALNRTNYGIEWKYQFDWEMMRWLSKIVVSGDRLAVLDDVGRAYIWQREI